MTQEKKALLLRAALPCALILLCAFLLPALLLRFSGDLLRPFAPDIAPYFLQLHGARFTWPPVFFAAAALLTAALALRLHKKQVKAAGLWLALFGIGLLLAALVTMRVNSIPMTKVISVLLALVKGGVL